MSLSLVDMDQARKDPAVFADLLVGVPLWEHQVSVVRSVARYRVITAGRRAGKSRVFGVIALHGAFVTPRFRVLIISAGEVAAKRLFAEIAGMAAGAPLLKGAVADESKSLLTLTNGSTIECVPASMAQVRSAEADLLIVDEAGFVPQDIWESAEPTVLARPGSRVLLCSSPWGGPGHFFRQLWRQGMSSPNDQVESWHWPSSISPLVDAALLESIRQRSSSTYFDREYLAIWTDGAGAYLTSAEIDGATADYELIVPGQANGQLAVGGVDWGLSDANALVLLAVLADGDLNREHHPERPVLFVPWLEEHYQMPYGRFIDRVLDVADPTRGGFSVRYLASETNGVGAFPTEDLEARAWRERSLRTRVVGVHTDNRRKESAYGAIKMLLQQGRLLLPRHPALLKQLATLEFTVTDAGNTRIAVPDQVGHDDLADALAQAISCTQVRDRDYRGAFEHVVGKGEILATGSGTRIHRRPRCLDDHRSFTSPKGAETGDGW